MLKSSNLESIINACEAEGQQPMCDDLPQLSSCTLNNNNSPVDTSPAYNSAGNNNEIDYNKVHHQSSITNENNQVPADSLATKQLAAGILQIFEPPLAKARGQLKELIGKQNKIYIDLSAEKYKLDNAETAKLHEMPTTPLYDEINAKILLVRFQNICIKKQLFESDCRAHTFVKHTVRRKLFEMNNVKIYREKLVRIKKQMQNIYQRTKVLKKRAHNVQTCKQKELQRKLHKQQQEEALIGKQQQQQNQTQQGQ